MLVLRSNQPTLEACLQASIDQVQLINQSFDALKLQCLSPFRSFECLDQVLAKFH